jgi:hypothetical protein
LSLYKVHFKWNDKDVTLRAKNLDLTHPYFVSIRDLVFPDGNKIIIDPSQDEIRKTFGKADHLMIPFQTVSLIEEYSDEREESTEAKVRNFTIVDENGSNDDSDHNGGSEEKDMGDGHDDDDEGSGNSDT